MAATRSVLYLVSGAEDIQPSHSNLQRKGRRVKFDCAVSDNAADVLRDGRRYVVVAHGNADGTVKWFNSSRGSALPWLWVNMAGPPKGSRIYLYACRVGRLLPRFLKHCEAFGHSHDVPMPLGAMRDVVLRFLDKVHELMSTKTFDSEGWRTLLAKHVNDELVEEVNRPSGNMMTVPALSMLRRSLGYKD